MNLLLTSYLIAGLLVVYSYLLYPALLSLLAPRIGRYRTAPPFVPVEELPRVTVMVAAHNEADVIAERIDNLLGLDYPPERLDIVIASDGSTDSTPTIVRGVAINDDRVTLREHMPNIGKSATLNRYIPDVKGDVIILSDANTHFAPDVARRLVRWLADPDIIAVSGKLSLVDPESGNNVDSAYWRYENRIKQLEGMLGAKLGANGAIYALRKRDFVPFPANTIVDDFVIPLVARLHHGGHIVFDASARATEDTPAEIGEEFQRRVRIGTGAYQSLQLLWGLLRPVHGWTAFCFFSHKVLRWLTPFLLVYMLAVSVIGLRDPVFQGLLLLESVVLLLAALGLRSRDAGRTGRILRMLPMFAAMNAALLVGWWRYLSTEQSGTWKRTARDHDQHR